MGWWRTEDNTLIGDQLADLVDIWLDELVEKLRVQFPSLTKDQLLHTLSFCSGYIPAFDDDKTPEQEETEKRLCVLSVEDATCTPSFAMTKFHLA